ncbi:MAG: hypothetical protein KBB88_00540 [Candidatus Pacebacteria bacterium]|nr:hypothetical protein [Candidatus Paceibacterota bacterium]
MIEQINTCLATTLDYHLIAYYSHVIPAAIALFLTLFVLIKAKFSFRSRVFALFLSLFTIWLIGDLIAWTAQNYYLISFVWSFLDYISLSFAVAGVYFFLVVVREKDLHFTIRLLLFLLTIPAFLFTVGGNSIHQFYQPACEAIESVFLTNYKLFVEVFGIIVIAVAGVYYYQLANAIKKRQILILGGSMFLFLLVFGATEYLASVTDIYEINLYSLLILPVFLLIITYSITNLHIFKIRFIETQLLVYILIIMTGSQLLFIKGIADISLSLLTLAVSIIIAFVLLRNVSKQQKQRKQIEVLALQLEDSNKKLDQQNKLKSEFLSLAAHQIRGPLTLIKGYVSLLEDGTYDKSPTEQKKSLTRIFDSANHLVNVVNDLLNISKIEQGGLVFEMGLCDLKRIIAGVVDEMKVMTKNKNIKLSFRTISASEYIIRADLEKLRQVFLNIIDNSFKYTNTGSIELTLDKDKTKNIFIVSIADTGIGMSQETISTLFKKFSRGSEGRVANSEGSGLGLYLAKQIVEAHQGTITVTSDGEGKGSLFTIVLPVNAKTTSKH